jgi:hypothetical protein
MEAPIIDIGPLGPVVAELPKSFAARTDLVQTYLQYQDDSPRLGRILAAAIALCWSGKRPEGSTLARPPRLPQYDVAGGKLLSFGTEVVDVLFGQLQVPLDGQVWTCGLELVAWCSASLPTKAGVDKRVDFISPDEGK